MGLVVMATLASSAAAGDGTYSFRIVCKSGKVVVDTLPVLAEPAKSANEQNARRHACPEEYDASGRPRTPLAPNPRFDDRDLFRQTLDDVLANRFRLRLTCPKACVIRSFVQIVVADKRLLLDGASSRHLLTPGRTATIPIRFDAAARMKLRGATLARVTGYLEVTDAKGGKRTVRWERTCRLAT